MFGIAKELSPEERFNEMEKKYSAIIERIQSYDKVLDQFEVILKTLDLLSSENVALRKGLKDAYDLIVSVNNSHLSAKQEISKNLQVIDQRMTESEKDISYAYNEHIKSKAELSSKIEERHLTALSALQEYAKNESLTSALQPLHNAVDYFHGEIASLYKLSEKGTKKHQDLDEKLQQVSDAHQITSRALTTTQIGLDGHKKDTNYMVASLRKQIENEVADVKDQVVTYMDNTKVEMIGSPGSMESVQRSISSRMDSIALDGSNAVLRSSNNEQMIKILEKKLANLAILLKKNEFAKMQDA